MIWVIKICTNCFRFALDLPKKISIFILAQGLKKTKWDSPKQNYKQIKINLHELRIHTPPRHYLSVAKYPNKINSCEAQPLKVFASFCFCKK